MSSTVTTIGDRVKLKGSNLVGIVRFIGPLKHKNGIYYGIELDEKKGTNDGSIGTIHYFKTEPKKAIFIKKSSILKTNTKYNQDIPRVTVNDTIYIKKFQCTATIRYIGSPEFKSKPRSKSLANAKKSSTRSLVSNSRSEWSETSCTSITPTTGSPYNQNNFFIEQETDAARPNTPNKKRSKFATFALNNVWYGVELNKPKGKNNGIVQGKWYFYCKPKYGSFIRKEQIEMLETDHETAHEADEKKSEYTPLTLNDTKNSSTWKRSNSKNLSPRMRKKSGKHPRQRSRSLEFTLNLDAIVNSGEEKEKESVKKGKKKDVERKSTLTAEIRTSTSLKGKKKTKNGTQKTRSISMVNRKDLKKDQPKFGSDISNVSKASDRSNTSNKSNKSDISNKKNSKFRKPFNDSDDMSTTNANEVTNEISKIEIVYNNYDEDNTNNTRVTTIGDRIKLNDELEGKVLFVGPVRDKNGIFYGIDLDKLYADKGKNDGSFRGKYYFETRDGGKSGLFVKEERIAKTFIGGNRRKRVSVNHRVYVDKFGCNGSVRFIGNTQFKKGIWYGIELDELQGKNDGRVDGVFYFNCLNGHGTFVKQKAFTPLDLPDNSDNGSVDILTTQDTDRSNMSMMSMASYASSMSLLRLGQRKRHDNLFMDILMTENDLAGFCLIWMIGLFYVILLRIRGNELVKETQWYSIIGIPLFICLMTWLFSYYITKYTKSNGEKESMKIPTFYIPFFCKVLVAFIFFGGLMRNIKDRTGDLNEFGMMCNASLIVMWFQCVLSVITSEIMITTVMVNSILKLDQLKLFDENKWYINIFLLITRPILWVYNRLIVMFVSFYLYYYLIFGIGPICLSICKVHDVKLLSEVGKYTLLLPFHNVLYLFEIDTWANFNLSKYNNTEETIFAVIQEVLVFTTIFDLLMDIWSIYYIVNRKDDEFNIPSKKETERELRQIIQVAPMDPQHLAVIPESQVKYYTQQLQQVQQVQSRRV